MQWATHDLSKFYIILYDQLKKNTVVDGCVFTLSQLLDTVETDIRIENSLGQLGNLNISGFLICLLICISGMKILDFETIDFDLGNFFRKNSLGRNDVDTEIKTFNCVKELQN